MGKAHVFICLMMVVLLWGMCLISRSEAVVPNDPFLGVPPQDEKYYKVSSDTIKCRDGSKTFTKAQLNDDYCDCPDGSDEPGTSACPQGKFYCQNAGHAPVQLFSSRVNDGICDCCDGGDEYDGQVKCPNTCWEAGKVARDKVKKKIATYKQGVTLRRRDIEQAKLQFAKDEAELSKLKNEESILKDLVQQLKVRKEQIDKAEEEERLQKEKEEKEKKAAEEKTEKEEHALVNDPNDTIGTLDDPHPDQDEVEQVDSKPENDNADDSKLKVSPPNEQEQEEAKEEKEYLLPHDPDDSVVSSEADQVTSTDVSSDPSPKGEGDPTETTEELSREELGRLVASRWTGSTEKQSTEEDDTNVNNYVDQEDPEETPQDTHNDEYDEYDSEIDDDAGKYDDADLEEDIDDTYEDDNNNNDVVSSYKHDPDEEEDFSDISSSSNPSWLEKIQQTVRNILQKVNLFQTPVDLSDAACVRKEYEESSKKLSKLQSRISSLSQKLVHDFGVDKEFYSFYDKCFEGKQNKYVYKICPFKQASQIEGHSTTRLGKWQKFEDSYGTMIFSNGDKCWNGPDRSLKVKLRCGFKTEVTDIDEPSRCEYLALLSTLALCTDERLKELEDKLELMNKERPKGHDEL